MSDLKRKLSKSDDEGPDRKILMAVDFGTTYSGLAWSQTRKVSTDIILLTYGINKYLQPEVQTPIIRWPDVNSEGLEGITSDKVPT